MFTRRFIIGEVPKRRTFEIRHVEKCYFRDDYDIYYFRITSHEGPIGPDYKHTTTTRCGIRLETQWDSTVEFEESLYESFAKECPVRIKKTISVMQLEEDVVLPITIIEIHEYSGIKLNILEIRFENEKLAQSFKAPRWAKSEITGDRAYCDMVLAYGIPEQAVRSEIEQTVQEAAFVEERMDIYTEAVKAKIEREQRLGTFEERLQKTALRKKQL